MHLWEVTMWDKDWRLDGEGSTLAGGQGTVRKVVSLHDPAKVGALKELHPAHLKVKERRYRFQQEVNALLVLGGVGVPRVLGHNVDKWEDKSAPLFIVMEWIAGPSLTDASPLSITPALACTAGILQTVARCHSLGLLHRDLKPDNIILRDGKAEQPILVDFGMSWSQDKPDQGFKTPYGQELGNRFLRLPEFAPGHGHHDSRSDVTLVVGVLFYMLTNRAPRVLQDGDGLPPHEKNASNIPPEVTLDIRWPKIRRIFHIGFQPLLDARFANAEALAARIQQMNDTSEKSDDEDFEREIAALQEHLESRVGQERDAAARTLEACAKAFLETFAERVHKAGLVYGGGGPSLTDGGWGIEFNFFIVRSGTSSPRAGFRYDMQVDNGVVRARVSIENNDWEEYYIAEAADAEGLEAANRSKAKQVATSLISLLRQQLTF